MSTNLSCPPRHFATIAGYRQVCAELELENAALRLELAEMRSTLHRQLAATQAIRLCGRVFDVSAVGATSQARH